MIDNSYLYISFYVFCAESYLVLLLCLYLSLKASSEHEDMIRRLSADLKKFQTGAHLLYSFLIYDIFIHYYLNRSCIKRMSKPQVGAKSSVNQQQGQQTNRKKILNNQQVLT